MASSAIKNADQKLRNPVQTGNPLKDCLEEALVRAETMELDEKSAEDRSFERSVSKSDLEHFRKRSRRRSSRRRDGNRHTAAALEQRPKPALKGILKRHSMDTTVGAPCNELNATRRPSRSVSFSDLQLSRWDSQGSKHSSKSLKHPSRSSKATPKGNYCWDKAQTQDAPTNSLAVFRQELRKEPRHAPSKPRRRGSFAKGGVTGTNVFEASVKEFQSVFVSGVH
ncbi:expressed unknown protein [Seminavis robusta]|uniref:Uncharacterized protein n=1 Tax=Seminavis robusta TaxID=568900 RepID=A0A9N8EV76_9STRA|nr:expressed unknown protein [Seminavis robusta]|eukprot:Sro2092_g314110.1 n/a (225) ;mRNA; r:15529-16203